MELQNEYTVMFALKNDNEAWVGMSIDLKHKHGIGKEEGHIVIVWPS